MLFCILFEYKVVFCLKWRSLLRSLSLYLSFILSRCRKPPPPLPGSHLRFTCVILLVTNYSRKMFNFSSISFTPFLLRFFLLSLLRIWKKKESNRISNAYLFKKLLLAMQFNISIFSSEDQSIIKGYLKAKIFFSYYSCICFFFFFFFRSDKFEEMGFASFWFHALLS